MMKKKKQKRISRISNSKVEANLFLRGVRGVHVLLCQCCILFIHLYFHNTYKFPYIRSIFFFTCVFASSYFNKDSFMQHALYVLNAPEGELHDIHRTRVIFIAKYVSTF